MQNHILQTCAAVTANFITNYIFRYHITRLSSETLKNIDDFERGFFRKYPLDGEPKSWMGSKTYLANPRFSNEYLAASAAVEQMYPVEKTMSIEELNKKNAKIFGKGTTPLLGMRASAVPDELIRQKCDQSEEIGGGQQEEGKQVEGGH